MITEARKILVEYWGHSGFRPMQEDIITSVYAGNDTLALLPTGGGKSICFQVPAMMMEGMCLVITPLIALMNDQVIHLKKLRIAAKSIHTGMHRSEIESTYSNALSGRLKFLYVSPERLENKTFQDVISKVNINLIAVDEAHCISQWGYDFRPPYLKIAEIQNFIKEAPFLALTATATPIVVEDIMNKLRFKQPKLFQSSFQRKNLAYTVYKDADKSGGLLKLFKYEKGSGIVYVRNRRKTRELAEILSKNNISASFYHAGLDARTRDQKQKEWINGHFKVMVSTNAFGMGIDKPDVRQVIHYDMPDCIESYFQEAGRAGRDGKQAVATLLYHNQDIVNAKRKVKEAFPPLDRIRIIYNALGNYLQLPEGSGKDQSFEFDIVRFSEHFEFNLMEVYSAIKILERDGYLYYNESAGQFSKIFIPIGKEELYRIMVENPGSDRLLKDILRSYAGVFTEYVNINETQLAKRTEIPKEEIIKKLNYLNKQKIINYVPVKTSPQIIYSSERLNTKNIFFSKENYTYLKEAAEKRLQSLLDFISNSLQCRSQQLLKYFGEVKSARCGICDVCLSKNKTELNQMEFENIRNQIKEQLAKGPVHLYNLISSVTSSNEEDIITVLRWQMENNEVIRQKDETLIWHKQLDINFD